MAWWPSTLQAPFEPQWAQEEAAEHHFSRTKRGAAGAASLSHGIWGTVREHLENFHRGFEDREVRTFEGMSQEECIQLSRKALHGALEFFSMCSLRLSVEQAYAMLKTWWDEGAGRQWLPVGLCLANLGSV